MTFAAGSGGPYHVEIINKSSDAFAGGNADNNGRKPLGKPDAPGKNRKHIGNLRKGQNPASKKETGKQPQNGP